MNEVIKRAQEKRVKVSYSLPEYVVRFVTEQAQALDIPVSVAVEAYLVEGMKLAKEKDIRRKRIKQIKEKLKK